MAQWTKLEENIIDLYELGWRYDQIAEHLNISENIAAEVIDEFIGQQDDIDPGDMDGDHQSALASAGWGMDEDYWVDAMGEY